MKDQGVSQNIDWISISIYIALVIMGWLNIYSSSLSNSAQDAFIFDSTQIYGKQFLFILFTIPIIFVVLFVVLETLIWFHYWKYLWWILVLFVIWCFLMISYWDDYFVGLKSFWSRLIYCIRCLNLKCYNLGFYQLQCKFLQNV